MINRVLIRIKVVQLLYSHMLTQSEFKIEPAAENPSPDKKYAHDLYMDLLLLVLELSGLDVTSGRRFSPLTGLTLDKHINRNALAKSLGTLEELRNMILKDRGNVRVFDSVVPALYAAIPTIPAYKNYSKLKQPDMRDDVALWTSIAKNLFLNNPDFIEAARQNPDFTMVGFERGVESFISTLADYGDTRTLLTQSRNALAHSLDKAYELYVALLQLSIAITAEQDRRIDDARNKYVPTDEDLNPNLRFVENKFVKALAENEGFREYVEDKSLSWETDFALVESLLNKVLASDLYAAYMARTEESTLEEDAEFWRAVYKDIILPSDELVEALENKSVYWNDDLHIMGTFVIKTVRKFALSKKDGADVRILPKYKDEIDEKFGPELFLSAVKHYDEYRSLIDRFVNSSRWDADRLAFMDIIIMVAAITELLDYPAIPVAVTLNEYIEIANSYSTARSGSFINGILYSVVNHLREEGRLNKK